MSDPPQQPDPDPGIRTTVRLIKAALLDLLTASKDHDTTGKETPPSSSIEDALDRFSLWAGNTGALHRPTSRLSLEHRLSEAPEIHQQICVLLEELLGHTKYLLEIISSPTPDSGQPEDSTYDDESDVSSSDESSSGDEVEAMMSLISECVRSLFRIAIVIRKATARDRFQHAQESSGPQFLANFDIDYVRHKHAKLNDKDWLVRRLGGAIAKRRQMIKYCRDHRYRLGARDDDGLATSRAAASERPLDAATEKPSTKATTLQHAPLVGTDIALAPDDEEVDDGATLMTANTIFEGSQRLRLPSLADLRNDGEMFECPLCYTLQTISREKAWKSHAFRDLKAYTCTAGDKCDALFGDRNSWFQHELQEHRSQYSCTLCGGSEAFPTRQKFRDHLLATHGAFEDRQIRALETASVEAPQYLKRSDCPFCDWETRSQVKQGTGLVPASVFKRHLASHQEQLAIFAIPRASEGEGGSADTVSIDTQSSRADLASKGAEELQWGSPTPSTTSGTTLSQLEDIEHDSRPQGVDLDSAEEDTGQPDGLRFACVFAYAGCTETFYYKDDWKMHVASKHMVVKFWLCTEPVCVRAHPETRGRAFMQKDLYAQHVRRAHPPEEYIQAISDDSRAPAWLQMLQDLQDQAERKARDLPDHMKCPLAGCTVEFFGSTSWDDRMDHVARHMEEGEPVAFGGDNDPSLTAWATQLRVDVVRRVGPGDLWRLTALATRPESSSVLYSDSHTQAEEQNRPGVQPAKTSLDGPAEPDRPSLASYGRFDPDMTGDG